MRAVIRLIPLPIVGVEPLYELLYLSGAADTWRTRGQTLPIQHIEALLLGDGQAADGVVGPFAPGVVAILRLGRAKLVGCQRT